MKGKDPRVALADWLTSKDNTMFRENMANRIWAHFIGRGIVDPVDDVRISNPPSNKELLEALGQHLADYNYDFKKLIRDICTSRTYQLSSTAQRNESRRRLRSSRMPNCAACAPTCCSIPSPGDRRRRRVQADYPTGFRALQLYEGNRRSGNYFLKTFGISSRDAVGQRLGNAIWSRRSRRRCT